MRHNLWIIIQIPRDKKPRIRPDDEKPQIPSCEKKKPIISNQMYFSVLRRPNVKNLSQSSRNVSLDLGILEQNQRQCLEG